MFRLLHLIAALCLVASLAGGSIAHAAEVAGGHEALSVSQGWHVDGDQDQVPGDRENGSPHHHNVCHGHDISTPAKAGAGVLNGRKAGTLPGIDAVVPEAGPGNSPLRPPIA